MKKIIPIILIIILILPTYILLGSTTTNYDAPSYYKTILINNGDTLTSISNNHNTSNMSNKEFIKYIKSFNGLKNDTIYYGNSIIIPVFENNGLNYEYAVSTVK